MNTTRTPTYLIIATILAWLSILFITASNSLHTNYAEMIALTRVAWNAGLCFLLYALALSFQSPQPSPPCPIHTKIGRISAYIALCGTLIITLCFLSFAISPYLLPSAWLSHLITNLTFIRAACVLGIIYACLVKMLGWIKQHHPIWHKNIPANFIVPALFFLLMQSMSTIALFLPLVETAPSLTTFSHKATFIFNPSSPYAVPVYVISSLLLAIAVCTYAYLVKHRTYLYKTAALTYALFTIFEAFWVGLLYGANRLQRVGIHLLKNPLEGLCFGDAHPLLPSSGDASLYLLQGAIFVSLLSLLLFLALSAKRALLQPKLTRIPSIQP